jgi:hypothetical protein
LLNHKSIKETGKRIVRSYWQNISDMLIGSNNHNATGVAVDTT